MEGGRGGPLPGARALEQSTVQEGAAVLTLLMDIEKCTIFSVLS